jgi:hypothetical protein
VAMTDEKYNTKTNDLIFGNDIHPEQQIPLSKKRVISTIPKVRHDSSLPFLLSLQGDTTPDHQPEGLANWVYPSQQQYYNAMKVFFFSLSSVLTISAEERLQS